MKIFSISIHQVYLKCLIKTSKIIFEKYLHKYLIQQFELIIGPKIKKPYVDFLFESISYTV